MSVGRCDGNETILSADTQSAPVLYAGVMVRAAVRQLLAEPRVPNPPRRVWRDWAIVGVLVPTAVLEVVVRDDLSWKFVALILGASPIVAMLWRRTHPLAVVAFAFALHAGSEAVVLFGAQHSAMLNTTAVLVLLPYSLFRWGSGRECAIGLLVMLVAHIPQRPITPSSFGEAALAVAFLLFPASIGTAVRYRTTSKVREVDQIKLREREQLARELHDTVAHHVSAIIIQAQAGRTVAVSHPQAAVTALEVIEAEASRTLAEMRLMVKALRQGDDAELAPQRGVADIQWLARSTPGSPHVDVFVAEGLDGLRPSVGAAIYRLAQESITNAIRHARHATRILVSVDGDDEWVSLIVRDDGDPSGFAGSGAPGYGLVGMAERAKLLGGTLEAGPGADRGWTITAVLPRSGAVS